MSLLLWSLLACRPAAEPGWEGPRVILLVLDGVRDEDTFGTGPTELAQGTPESQMPNSWDTLVPDAARALGGRSAGITVTGPAHVTLFGGQHAPFGNYHNETGVSTYRPDLPMLMETLRASNDLRRDQVLLLGNTTLIEPTAWSRQPALGEQCGARWVLVGNNASDSDPDNGGTDDKVVFDTMRDEITAHAPVFIAANLHQVDRSTHGGEFDDYGNHLTILDAQIPTFWEFVQSQPDYTDNTWLILAADHGRHDDADTSPPWRHHGDSCQGCRGVPWLVLGPDVAAGTDFDAPVLLEDLATTIAALFDTPMPFSQGRVVTEAFTRDLAQPPKGLLDAVAAGSAVAELHRTDDPAHRQQLWLGDQLVSDPEAMLVASPAMAQDRDTTWLCTRSLVQDFDAAEVPWVRTCGVQQGAGSAFQDLALPWTPAAPYDLPVLLPDGSGGLLVLSAPNPTGVVATSQDNDLGLHLHHYRDGAWTETSVTSRESFPTLPAAVLHDGQLVAVVAAGDPGQTARDTRALYTATWTLETDTWTELLPTGVSAADGPRGLERPALAVDDDGALILAALAHGVDDTTLLRARSTDLGATWTRSDPLSGLEPLPHLTPLWVDGQVVYGAWDPDSSQSVVCTVAPAGTTPSCTDTGAEQLQAILDTDDGLEVVTWSAGGWTRGAL